MKDMSTQTPPDPISELITAAQRMCQAVHIATDEWQQGIGSIPQPDIAAKAGHLKVAMEKVIEARKAAPPAADAARVVEALEFYADESLWDKDTQGFWVFTGAGGRQRAEQALAVARRLRDDGAGT
jgi:hypothetical protein